MVFKSAFCAALALLALDLAMDSALAQQMGRDPWGFPQGNPTFAAQAQLLKRQSSSSSASSSSSGSGSGDTNTYVTNNLYSNSSTSIGNWNEIQQTLGAGAQASLELYANQNNLGNIKSSSASSTTTLTAQAVPGSQQTGQSGSQTGPFSGQQTIQNGNH